MVKGKITNLLLACVMGVSIVAAVDSSTYAKVGDNSIIYQNMYNYLDINYGTYADIFCRPGYTQVTAKKTGYYGTFKLARYHSSKKIGKSKYEVIDDEIRETTSQPCHTELRRVSDNVARRYHNGYIKSGTEKTSPKVQQYVRTAYKEDK